MIRPSPAEREIESKYGERTVDSLHDILRFTESAAALVARGREWFESDPVNVPGLAAESLIVKIGEAATRLRPEFIDDHPEIPWRLIKDMRNRLAHYYEGTDYEFVWNTLESNFPQLEDFARKRLA